MPELDVRTMQTLPQRVKRLAEEHADGVAIRSIEHGAQTWQEIFESSLRWACALREAGVSRGDVIATMLPQSLEPHHVWLACGWLKAVETAINVEYRGEWLRGALESTRPKVVVIHGRHLPQLADVREALAPGTLVIVVGPPTQVQAGDPTTVAAAEFLATAVADHAIASDPARPWDAASIVFTSGTTGPSKGAVLSWAQFEVHISEEPSFARPREQVLYLPFGVNHLTGKGALQRAAYFDCQSVVREKMSASSFWADIDEHGCTWTILLPMMAELLRRSPASPADRRHPLRRVLTAPVVPYIDELADRFGFEVTTVYGTTEIGTPFSLGPDECNGRNWKSCGRAATYIEYRIVDEHDVEVAPGEAGELIVRSKHPWLLTGGYVSRLEDTVRAWRNGWFHTGDLLRLRRHDGQLEFVDRLKDAIRRRGENISSMEVETAIHSIPGIAECAVIGVPSDLGEEDVMAVIALADPASAAPSPADVREALAGIVPRYAVPRYIRVVSRLPRTEVTLRVQKARLRGEGVTPDTWDAEASHVTPGTAM